MLSKFKVVSSRATNIITEATIARPASKNKKGLKDASKATGKTSFQSEAKVANKINRKEDKDNKEQVMRNWIKDSPEREKIKSEDLIKGESWYTKNTKLIRKKGAEISFLRIITSILALRSLDKKFNVLLHPLRAE